MLVTALLRQLLKISILRVATTLYTPGIKSIILASKVLRKNKNKKEVKNDLLSKMAPPIIQRCSTTQSFSELSFTCLC